MGAGARLYARCVGRQWCTLVPGGAPETRPFVTLLIRFACDLELFLMCYIFIMENRTNSTYKTKVIKKTLFRTQLFNNNVNVSTVKVQKNSVQI